MRQQIQIGRVAKETGFTVDAIRFYEKAGLVERPPRTEGGFRLFRPEDVEKLKFIRKARELGFSLQETRELLLLQDDHVKAGGQVRDLAEHKLACVRRKIHELRKLEMGLKDALRRCNRKLKQFGEIREECCPVLEQLGSVNTNQEN